MGSENEIGEERNWHRANGCVHSERFLVRNEIGLFSLSALQVFHDRGVSPRLALDTLRPRSLEAKVANADK